MDIYLHWLEVSEGFVSILVDVLTGSQSEEYRSLA